MKDYQVDAVLSKMTTEKQQKRAANRKRKLAIDYIKGNILCGNVKKAIDIAEKHHISPAEFGKIVGQLRSEGYPV